MDIKQKAFNQINQLKFTLERLNYTTSQIEQKNYNYEFVVSSNDNKIKVQVYYGKKGIRTILQGKEDSLLYKELKKIIYEQTELDFTSPEFEEPDEYIGTDESGKGDIFGPLVIASVYVNKTTKNKLKEVGVRDSKTLNETQISHLSKEIISIVGNNYNIVSISPKKYNTLYEEFKNLNKLLNWAHSKAIENLLDNVKCNIVITDKFSNSTLNIENNKNHSSVEFRQITKAEKFVGVAAASILARNKFNEWFIKHSKAGLDFFKGSSRSVDHLKELIKKIGKENLVEYAKLHYKTIKDILQVN